MLLSVLLLAGCLSAAASPPLPAVLKQHDQQPQARTNASASSAPKSEAKAKAQASPSKPRAPSQSAPAAAAAEASATAPSHTGTLAALARLQTETALLKAKLQIADLKAKLAESGAAPQDNAGPGPNTPYISGLYGRAGQMKATLIYPNGGQLNVARGSTLPGGWRVAAINSKGVIIRRGHHSETLLFGAGAAPPVQMPTPLPAPHGG
jgi:type IV pilus biogenesis protein PilP